MHEKEGKVGEKPVNFEMETECQPRIIFNGKLQTI